MSNNDFKRGMEAGVKPFNDKFNEASEAINSVGEGVYKKIDSLSGVMDVVIDDLNSIRKKELYDLNTKFDIKKDLDNDEQELLSALMIEISKGGLENNVYQQKFFRSVNAYMGINNTQVNLNMKSIENIENLSSQKAILQVIMEYLFLEYGSFEFWEDYEEKLFDYFNVNKKGVNEIKECIKVVYNATGFKGIAEKYGYVAEAIFSDENKLVVNQYKEYDGSDICEKCADAVNTNQYAILDDYLVSEYKGLMVKINKSDGSKEITNIKAPRWFPILGDGKYVIIRRKHENKCFRVNIDTLIEDDINLDYRFKGSEIIFKKGKIFYIIDIDNIKRLCIYNCEDRKTHILKYCNDNQNIFSLESYYVHEDNIYIKSTNNHKGEKEGTLYKYRMSTRILEKICEIPEDMYYGFLRENNTHVYNSYLFSINVDRYNSISCSDLLYIDLNHGEVIRHESLPISKYDEAKVFVVYGVIYYVKLNINFSIHKYELDTRKTSVINSESGCGSFSKIRTRFFKWKNYFKLNGELKIVGKWIYYNKENIDNKVFKCSTDTINGTSKAIEL